jgi:hypothetical protein
MPIAYQTQGHAFKTFRDVAFTHGSRRSLFPAEAMLEVKGCRRRRRPPYHDRQFSRTMLLDKQALLEEERRMRRLRRSMDLAAALLRKVDLTLEEAQDVVEHAKRTALTLFPDKEAAFDLIYGPRFRRILVEKYRLQ